MTGSGNGMVPSGRGVGLAAAFGVAAGLGVDPLRGVGEEVASGIGGRVPGAGKGARVGNGAGVPMGEIEGSAPGVGNPDSAFVWPFTKTIEARKIPQAANSDLSGGM